MGGRTFDCLDAVINRYKTEQIVEGHTLGHYIKRVSEINISRMLFETYMSIIEMQNMHMNVIYLFSFASSIIASCRR